MTEAFLRAVEVTLRHETGGASDGGYVDHPDDPGGATRWGISQRSHPREDIRHLTRERAIEIYHERYWKPLDLDHLSDEQLAALVFDAAVHHGPSSAVRILQRACNWLEREGVQLLDVDGQLGPKTRGRIARERYPDALRLALKGWRFKRLTELPHAAAFAAGWTRRALG